MTFDFLHESKAVKHTHTAAGTAEEVDGGFDYGAEIAILPHTANTFVGTTKLLAENNGIGTPAGTILRIRLQKDQNTLWVDTSTSGIVSVFQTEVR